MTAVYLQTVIPAMVTYVLGDAAWESEVKPETMMPMPTANWTDNDEMALSMRILQAGGTVVDLSSASGDSEKAGLVARCEWREAEKRQKYLFGWPESGGVWVLDLPEWAEYDPFEGPPEQRGVLKRRYNGALDCNSLREIKSMEELCLAFKDLGARFYEDAKNSNEVRELGLLEKDACLLKSP